jgi:orotate phosphoribosyltransferase
MSSTPSTVQEALLHHLRQAAALGLWRAEAVRISPEEPFTLASGKKSPIYINCRRLISSPAFLGLFTAVAHTLVETGRLTFDAVAGGETAGIPFAAYLARDTGKPMLYVRKQAKGYGIASRVEGVLPAGRSGQPPRVLLVEDLITDGGSKIGFIEALREAGAVVDEALVLFDRQQGGGDLLGDHGVQLTAVTDLATTLGAAETAGTVAAEALAAVRAYLADPEGWAPR